MRDSAQLLGAYFCLRHEVLIIWMVLMYSIINKNLEQEQINKSSFEKISVRKSEFNDLNVKYFKKFLGTKEVTVF